MSTTFDTSFVDPRLAPRERQVLAGLAIGRSYKQIAAELGISIDTVRTYIRTLYRKLDVHSATEAILWLLAQRAHDERRIEISSRAAHA